MFKLPPLPYPDNALEPVISANTISYHYGKHHKKYVDDLNKLIAGTEYESASLEKVIAESAGQAEKVELFNNAAQTWNHTFYWLSMKRGGGGKPTGKLAGMIDMAFGGFDNGDPKLTSNSSSVTLSRSRYRVSSGQCRCSAASSRFCCCWCCFW